MYSGKVEFLAGMFSTWAATHAGRERPTKEERRIGQEVAEAAAKAWDRAYPQEAVMTIDDLLGE